MEASRKPTLQERAAYLRVHQAAKRRAQARKPAPWGALPKTFDNARDALEVALEATGEELPEQAPKCSPATVPWKASQGKGATGDAKRYGTHYRTRLTGKGRKVYVRTDAWARERSIETGTAKLWGIVTERRSLNVRADNVRGIGNGIEPRSWDELHNAREMDRLRALRFSTGREKDLWILRTLDDSTGRAVFEMHAETGEIRKA